MMKITKKQWEEIQEYIREYALEIWDMAVRNTTRSHDAEVWLDGISTRKYSLWVGMYTTGTVKADSLLVYQLPRNWQDYIEDVDDGEYYDAGFELFEKELRDPWFWHGVANNNNIEITD